MPGGLDKGLVCVDGVCAKKSATEAAHLVGPLTYMGHLGIFKTVKNPLTWATHLDGPLT